MLTRSQAKKINSVCGKRKEMHDERSAKGSCAKDPLEFDSVNGAVTTTVRKMSYGGDDVIIRSYPYTTGWFRRSDEERETPEGYVVILTRTAVHRGLTLEDSYQEVKSGHMTHGVFDRVYSIKEEPADIMLAKEERTRDRRATHHLKRLTYVHTQLHNAYVFLDFESYEVKRCVIDTNDKKEGTFYMKETWLGIKEVHYGKWQDHNFVGLYTVLNILSAKDRRVFIAKYSLDDPNTYQGRDVIMEEDEFKKWFDDMFILDMYKYERSPQYGNKLGMAPYDFSIGVDKFDSNIKAWSAPKNKDS